MPIDSAPHLSKEIVLLLLAEELKSYKLFSGLRALGLDDVFYQCDLSSLVLAHFNMDADANAVNDFYYDLLGAYSGKIQLDRKSVLRVAEEMYGALGGGCIT